MNYNNMLINLKLVSIFFSQLNNKTSEPFSLRPQSQSLVMFVVSLRHIGGLASNITQTIIPSN